MADSHQPSPNRPRRQGRPRVGLESTRRAWARLTQLALKFWTFIRAPLCKYGASLIFRAKRVVRATPAVLSASWRWRRRIIFFLVLSASTILLADANRYRTSRPSMATNGAESSLENLIDAVRGVPAMNLSSRRGALSELAYTLGHPFQDSRLSEWQSFNVLALATLHRAMGNTYYEMNRLARERQRAQVKDLRARAILLVYEATSCYEGAGIVPEREQLPLLLKAIELADEASELWRTYVHPRVVACSARFRKYQLESQGEVAAIEQTLHVHRLRAALLNDTRDTWAHLCGLSQYSLGYDYAHLRRRCADLREPMRANSIDQMSRDADIRELALLVNCLLDLGRYARPLLWDTETEQLRLLSEDLFDLLTANPGALGECCILAVRASACEWIAAIEGLPSPIDRNHYRAQLAEIMVRCEDVCTGSHSSVESILPYERLGDYLKAKHQ